MAISEEKLLDAGVRSGLIDARQLVLLRQTARKERYPLLLVVQAHYCFPMTVLYRAVAEQLGYDYVDLYACSVLDQYVKKIPPSVLRRKQLLPVQQGEQTWLAVSDPFDRATIDSIQRLLGQTFRLAVASPEAMEIKISQQLAETAAPGESKANEAEEPDLVGLLDLIIREAYFYRASDIHLLAGKNGLRVRFRVDGRLRDHPINASVETAAALISRVKVLADLDISEQRQPQDGGCSYHLSVPIDRTFNIRVATSPIRLGERVTMRLLGQDINALTLSDLGMSDEDLRHFKKTIEKPYGLILLTGPTGSGKSTTLCAALEEINRPEINIMTVENPIEYVVKGASQVQTGPKISFASALRSFLRHDPDVLMIGEIRDHETADVAVKAAMTGHMVFSTLHTNNAVSAVTRMIDIGCEHFLIGSTVTAIIAQRLVRKLCVHCRQPRLASVSELQVLGVEDKSTEIYQPIGCSVCQGTGYLGRLGLFETLWFDDKLSQLVMRGAGEEDIEKCAGSNLTYMWDDGMKKVLQGLTSLDEVRNVAVLKVQETLDPA